MESIENETPSRNAFDILVSGIDGDERRYLLDKIRSDGGAGDVHPMPIAADDERTRDDVEKRMKAEPWLYRFLLWLRSVITKKPKSSIYNSDMLLSLHKKTSVSHPGLASYPARKLLTVFYEKLCQLKDCADFFRPYVEAMRDDKGEFYVFMCSFLSPEILQRMQNDADPYSIPFERNVTAETRSSLLRKLDDALKEMGAQSKRDMYSAALCLEWLSQFSRLPYLHFLSQFTAAGGAACSCPFSAAKADYPAFARVMSAAMTVSDEALEALFLFPFAKSTGKIEIDTERERALHDFFLKASSKFLMMQSFVSTVPIVSLGRLIFGSCDWQAGTFGGAEDWQTLFRTRLRDALDSRWEQWLRDRKKAQLSEALLKNFKLDSFPELSSKPWRQIWGGVQFQCEMTAGFLVWFNENEYRPVSSALSVVLNEGVFARMQNHEEFASTLRDFDAVNQRIGDFIVSIAPRGSISQSLDAVAAEKIRSLKNQEKVDSIMASAEGSVHEISADFCAACRSFEKIFSGIFDDDTRDSNYDTLQNLNAIKGRGNKEFRERLLETRALLKGAKEILAEIEPLDMPRGR